MSLMNQNWCKRLLLLSLAGAFVVTSTGCNERDVAAGVIIGGVIGGAIAGATSDDGYSRRDHRRDHRRDRFERRRDRRDHRRDHRRDRRDRDRFGWHSADMAGDFTTSAFLDEIGLVSKVDAFSQRFQVSQATAETYVDAVEQAQAGDVEALNTLGLTSSDIEDVASLRMPSRSSVHAMATKLNVTSVKAEEILAALVDETRVQFADINSDVWATCMAGGKWKTPENSYCKDTDWNGCSPGTGASKCMPAQ